jgi:hypothetical protein
MFKTSGGMLLKNFASNRKLRMAHGFRSFDGGGQARLSALAYRHRPRYDVTGGEIHDAGVAGLKRP